MIKQIPPTDVGHGDAETRRHGDLKPTRLAKYFSAAPRLRGYVRWCDLLPI
jgi:hypothetical protein